MKNIFLSLLLIFSTTLYAKSFKKEASVEPQLVQEGSSKHWCPVCGMSLQKFYKTSHSATLHNGTKRQYCSIRCLAVDSQEYGINKNNVQVVDIQTQKLINATKAYYVVGSKVRGTMSKKSKLAFENKNDAQNFIKKYKGKLTTFDDAFLIANRSLDSDIAMIKKRKQKKIYPMGKRIYDSMCDQNIDLTNYLEINELKADIRNNKLCKKSKGREISEGQLQVVSVYLWEVKRFGELKENKERVVVKENEKCPVCGMFTYKYPRWAAQIHYKHNDHTHHFSFDGVKDLMKFYFNPLKWGTYKTSIRKNITKIVVTDYYSQKAIDGTKAYYVIGSDIYGPMGHELIPFALEQDAQTFKEDHKGTAIITFDEIKELEVYKLD